MISNVNKHLYINKLDIIDRGFRDAADKTDIHYYTHIVTFNN
jgi:hypothetical protein